MRNFRRFLLFALCLFAVVTFSFSATATSNVQTFEELYIGEYETENFSGVAHIVFGTVSDITAEYGIIIKRVSTGEQKTFKGQSIGDMGKFGIAIYNMPEGEDFTVCAYSGKTQERTFGQEVSFVSGNKTALSVSQIVDSIVTVEPDRPIRVLQLTDTQIIDASQERTPDRLNATQESWWAKDKMQENAFKYIEDAVNRTNPDLIIFTGDLVYGEFDDLGTTWLTFIEHMDRYKIPWAPVYGNHDNESQKGALWQNEMLEKSKYCLFKKGTTDGNGNYTVGIKQGGKIVRVFYMMDSNHCAGAYNPTENGVITSNGFTANQIEWLYGVMEDITEANGGTPIPSSMAWHVPTYDHHGAQLKYYNQTPMYTINLEVKGENGDFGSIREGMKSPFSLPQNFISVVKSHGVDSTFVGHSHCVNTSILHQGIRWTFGLKTGIYDRYTAKEVGGTSIIIDGANVTVSHVYYDQEYQKYMDELEYVEPEKVIEVAGMSLTKDLTLETGLTVTAVEHAQANAYKVSASSQGKIIFNVSALRNKSKVTFSMYVPASTPKLGGLGPIAIRLKPDDGSASNVPGAINLGGKYYLNYDVNNTLDSAKLVLDGWKTYTVDISTINSTVTEFSIIIPSGATVYFKDIAIS